MICHLATEVIEVTTEVQAHRLPWIRVAILAVIAVLIAIALTVALFLALRDRRRPPFSNQDTT